MNPAKHLLAAASLAISATAVPAVAADYYVSTAGIDANAGTAPGTAFGTIARAVAVAQDGDTVHVLTGTYEVASAVTVSNAVAIVGETGDPADVIVRNTAGNLTRESGANSVDAHRVFVLDNAGAVLSGLAVEGGVIGGYADRKGGNVLIEANGGTVTNCILRNAVMVAVGPGDAAKSQAGGAAIASMSANGLITHCVITNNFATRGSTSIGFGMAGGSIVHVAAPGVIRDCLVAYNATRSDNFGSAVFLGINSAEGTALMENCTIAGNRAEDDAGDFYPVFFSAASWGANYNPRIRNTLIVGNVGTSGSRKLFADAWVGNHNASQLANAYGRFASCATDSELPDGLAMITEGIRLRSGFRPIWNSSTVDAGAEMQSPVALDLAGNPRVLGSAVDIGCYEYNADEPGPVDDPEFDPPSGVTFSQTIRVSLSCMTEGATIRYTTDRTDPTEASDEYVEAIVVSRDTTIKARAFKDGRDPSGIVSATYMRGSPTPPAFGAVTVTPRATSATLSGEIASVGNNLATSCDIYLAYGTRSGKLGEKTRIASGATTSFDYVIPGLRPETKYYYQLMASNNAAIPKTASTEIASFTTTRPDDFDYCVSTTGSDANDGTTRDTAFATIAHAVDVATDNQKICVLEGTYEIDTAIAVTKALTIFGDTGDPADVVVRNTAGPSALHASNSKDYGVYRVFELKNAGAVLAGIAVERGRIGGAGDFKGGNILINTEGGTVTNCIIRNAVMYALGAGGWPKTQAGGAGIASLSANGLITHCVITNNFATRGISDAEDPTAGLGIWGSAAAVHIQGGGTLRQSLIAYNTTTNDACGSAVFLGNAGTLMENCTVAANRGLGSAGNFYPVLFYPGASEAANPLIRNTLFFENEGTAGSRKLIPDVWVAKYSDNLAAAYARFVSCATDSILPAGLEMINEGIRVRRGFRPIETSSTVDAGAEMLSPVGLDLAGKPRIVHDVVDIGCYESSGILPTLLILR